MDKIKISALKIGVFLFIFTLSNIVHGRRHSSLAEKNFLVLSNIHLNLNQKNTMEKAPIGYNAKNDMDQQSFLELIKLIKKNVGRRKSLEKPDFILLLGGLVGHRSPSIQKRAGFVNKNKHFVFKNLLKNFPKTPIFYVFGNTDSPTRNYGDFENKKNNSSFTTAMAAGFKNGFLSSGKICGEKKKKFPCIAEQDKNEGFYSAKIAKELTLIALNSIMFSSNYKRNKKSNSKQEKQWKFFEKQLKEIKKNKERALIAMHIPVGNNRFHGAAFWKRKHRDRFLRMIKKYNNEIVAVLTSYTHMEEFQIIKKGAKDIGQYYTAALSTSYGNAPSIKKFYINKAEKWLLTDYKTFGIYEKNKKLTLSTLYSFKERYCKEKKEEEEEINNCLKYVKQKQLRKHITVDNPNYSRYPINSPKSFIVK